MPVKQKDYFKQTARVADSELLEFEADTGGLYLVNADQPYDFNGKTYLACRIELTKPDGKGDSLSQVKMVVDLLNPATGPMVAALKELKVDKPPTLTIRQVMLYPSPNKKVVEIGTPIRGFRASNFEINQTRISCDWANAVPLDVSVGRKGSPSSLPAMHGIFEVEANADTY